MAIGIDRALDNCRKVLDHLPGSGLLSYCRMPGACVVQYRSAAQARKRKDAVAYSDERLHSVLMLLEEARATLIEGGDADTAQIVAVSILQLRMNLNRIPDSDLKALCDEMTPDAEPPKPVQDPKPQPAQRRRRPGPVLLKLVK